jgi:esterase/lipase
MMEAQIFVAGIVGLLIGGVLTWLVSRSRFQREIVEKTAELEGKAKYAEGQVEQLKTQVSHADEDFGKMRIELDEEKGKSIETVVRLEEATRNLEQQKELVILMKNEMVETFKAHASSALETSTHAIKKLGIKACEMNMTQAASLAARLKYPEPRRMSDKRRIQINVRTDYLVARYDVYSKSEPIHQLVRQESRATI